MLCVINKSNSFGVFLLWYPVHAAIAFFGRFFSTAWTSPSKESFLDLLNQILRGVPRNDSIYKLVC